MIIAGTGHRPKYCPCQYNDNHPWLVALKEDLMTYLVEQEHHYGRITIRAGGAIGWDTWLAQVALQCGFELHLYLPFPNQPSRWRYFDKKEYERIRKKANLVHYTSENYYPKVFLDRDVQMITGANQVVSLLNPEAKRGGTYFTVKEAEKLKIPITNFWRG